MPDPDANPLAAMFDRAAATYDRVGVDFFQPIADQLVGHLAPQPGERVLDVGCGRGAVLFPSARAVTPGGRATGIDLSPGMVAATRAEAEDLGLAVDVRVGDAVLSEDVGEFDVIASSLVLFFLADPLAALATWHEHLAPGGRVGVSTFGPYDEAWRSVDEVLASYRPEAVRDPRGGADSAFASDAGVEALFLAAGFDEVATSTSSVDVRFRDPDHWYEWSWSVGQRGMWERIPEHERPRVRAEAAARMEGCRDGDGRIGFTQVVRFTFGRRAIEG
jgi:SAM-dependent methyltransferase